MSTAMLLKPTIAVLLAFAILTIAIFAPVDADSLVNKNEIIEALSEPPSRGIKITPKKKQKEELQDKVEQAIVEETTEDTELASEHGLVVLDIKFEFNSSVLSSSAIKQLDELGAALSSEQLNTGVFEVSGHTDSKGSAAYNKSLSLKRAQSVESYLLKNFKISGSQLNALGYGEEKPIFVTDPTNGANRRVEIRRLQ